METDVYKSYAAKNDLIFTMLVGSQSFDIVDERSDYDMMIFAKQIDKNWHQQHQRLYLLHDDGSRVHWYADDWETIQRPRDFFFFAMSLFNHQPEHVYVKNKTEYNKLINQKREILIDAYTREVENPESPINRYRDIDEIGPQQYSKDIYRYLLGWYFIKYGTVTEEQKEWLNELKRIRWNPVDPLKLKETLSELQEAINFLEVK